jgi:formamidopyrimidine-DNA glycosylase
MPELPEVETVRRGVARFVPGHRLDAVELRRHDLRFPIPVRAVRRLRGRSCTAVERRAKYLLLRFDGPRDPVAIVHLGMTGRLFVDALDAAGRRGSEPAWIPHEHWRMRFGSHLLRFVDVRRFGVLDVAPADRLCRHRLLAPLGPEPLSDEFDGAALFRRSRRRKVAVKALLMDARTVVGVGNIYASEACFHAGIRPRRAAGRLTRAECERLVTAVRSVLTAALDAGGTTIRDYRGVDREAGFFKRQLMVYEREGRPCRRCATPVRRVVLAGRSTYYCPRCQA